MLETITTVTTATVTLEQVLTGLGLIFLIIMGLFSIVRMQRTKN